MSSNLMPDRSKLYLFIIWEKSRNKSDQILEDLKNKFIIRDVYEVKWSKENFLNNLKRFYGQSLPDAQQKAELCGTGPFLLVLISDPNPKFANTKVVFERDLVNSNVHDCKVKYREWIGKDFTVHSTVSDNETDHNLTLLFGKNSHDLEKELPMKWTGEIKRMESDLIGHNGWKDMKELLYVLNGTTNYVILRNFEGMPEEFDYRDVDMLADEEKLAFVINKDFSMKGGNTRSFEAKVGDKQVIFNPNYIGDHYYDIKWERDILKRRGFHPNGFYMPSKEDYFYTLLYHVIFHKRKGITPNKISDKYKKTLNDLSKDLKINSITEKTFDDFHKSKKLLEKYMAKMSYRNSSTFQYKITHNESTRLAKVAISIARTQGIVILLIAIKDKIKTIIK